MVVVLVLVVLRVGPVWNVGKLERVWKPRARASLSLPASSLQRLVARAPAPQVRVVRRHVERAVEL